ncbi:MAG: cation diffusion facilitator family transporter [Firmicutes bacterium]|nr:cation diffusion facilitator family transporter [Bacillota bacterium]
MKVARLSVISNSMLTAAKLAVGISMNSVSVISETVHSGLDLVASLIAFFSVREAAKPADERHRYGHGKFENVASIVEALLIAAAAVMIISHAVPRIYGGGEVEQLGLGAAVMGISAVVNFAVSRRLMQVAKKTESPALAADAWHLLTDVYTSLGVFLGIGGMYLTGLKMIDPLVAVGVALLIFKAAYDLLRDSMRSILDVRLPLEEERKICDVLQRYSGEFIEFHDLRTRKAGSQRYVDLHLVMPKNSVVAKVHALCERIEAGVREELPGVHILIHTEPCGRYCEDCTLPGKQREAAQHRPACAGCDACDKGREPL